MFWQLREIYKWGVISNEKSTVPIELPNTNYLSALWLNCQVTNGSTAGDKYITQGLTKVEVIANGSRELVSLDGNELFLLTSYLMRRTPPSNLDKSANAVQRVSLLIPFGRYPGDPEYFLDCGDFASLELRTTFDFNVGPTGVVDESLMFEVIGLMAMEGAPGVQRGHLKTSRKGQWVSVANEERVIDLPRKNLYRKLGIAIVGEAEALEEAINRYQLDVNNAERIIEVGRILSLKYRNELDSKHSVYHPAVGDLAVIDLDRGDDMAHCLNSAAFDRVSLTVAQTTAGHDLRVLLQEVEV